MRMFSEVIAKPWLAMTGRKSPWGSDQQGEDAPEANASGGESGGSDSPPPDGPAKEPAKGPRNPWLPPASEGPPRRSANMEDILRPGTRKGGGGGGGFGFPQMPPSPGGRGWTTPIVATIALLWIGFSTTHMLGSNEQGIVTTFGKYTRTVGPGVSLTLPWPIQKVTTEDVTSIKRDLIPEDEAEKLMITSDRGLVDISYLVRWNIKDLKLYTFQLHDPHDAVKEVAEAAMRAAIAEVTLNDVMSKGRAQIEQRARDHMQAILDAYRSGVKIQGVDIKKTDPPAKVKEAFQRVTVAQQNAQQEVYNAQQWAQQLVSQSEGNAAEFDKVYIQYKLSPEVTKRRIYYETMERVLTNNDKVIVEANGVTPYLPLSEVKRGSAPEPAAQGGQ